MHILILGAAGMVGRKLTERLLREGRLGKHEITRMTLQDVVTPAKPANASIPIEVVASDFADAGAAAPLIADRPEVIFHLAAIVSGEAEAEFDKGYRINLDGTRYLIDAIRHAGGGYKPRLVFTSSIAVFGAPFPEKIGDEFFHTPLTSYGTQKSICELLINDYTRKGLLDGIIDPPADDLRAAGQAEQGRFRLLLQHHPRAARGRGGRAAGLRGRAALARLAEIGGGFSDPRRHHGPQRDGAAA